jgi:hypothetical protein
MVVNYMVNNLHYNSYTILYAKMVVQLYMVNYCSIFWIFWGLTIMWRHTDVA